MTTHVKAERLSKVLRPVLAPARWLERARGRKRLALVVFYCIVVCAIGLMLWRQSRLAGLPDVGDPVDAAPLYALRVPDEQNAFVLYAKASAKAHRDSAIEKRLLGGTYAWPAAADTEGIAFLAANEEALSLWREGCERPDALHTPIREISFETRLPLIPEHRHFFRLAQVHASKCEAAGDMAGAWDWYRIMLRGSRLIGRHGTVIARLVGGAEYSVCASRIDAWAADPRVDAALLTRALNEVQAINAMTARNSQSLQIEYLASMRMIRDPERYLKFYYQDPWNTNDVNLKTWYYHLPNYWRARWFIEHEPKVSVRCTQLVFTNWLAQIDLLPAERGPLVKKPGGGPNLHDIDPPHGALRARALVERAESSFLAGSILLNYDGVIRAYDRDLTQRAGLVVNLADKLFERKYGKTAKSPDDLIGTCLKRFPDGYIKPQDDDESKAR
jgi:hypothetical protein